MSDSRVQLSDELRTYLLAMSVREPDCLARLRAESAGHPSVCMQVTPEVGQFLSLLVRLTTARRVIELGTFMGYSALWMALALPPEGRVLTIDINRDWNEVARRHWQEAGVADRIEARLSPGLVELERLLAEGGAEQYDLAFLDADKRNYPVYGEQLLALLRPGGLLVADNVLWNGRVINPRPDDREALAIQRFNEQLSRDPRLLLSMVPLGDGLMLAIKNGSGSAASALRDH
jgi:caffeoyl-CoA O-methyltransferase